MHQNSLDAYDRIAEVKGDCRKRVHECIVRNRAITAKEIAKRLGWDINCVTPRICELKKLGAIVEGGHVTNDKGFLATLYSPTGSFISFDENPEYVSGNKKVDHIVSLNTGQTLKNEVSKVNADEYYGEYLKAEDVKQEVNVTIDGVELETIDGERKLVIQLLGFNKKLVLNKTNKDRLKAKFGTAETDTWLKKDFRLGTEMVQFKGEEVPALRVKAETGAS